MKEPMLYREDLVAEKCDCPDCKGKPPEGIYFHPACHPEAPTWVMFDIEIGGVILECSECGERVASIAVASKKR